MTRRAMRTLFALLLTILFVAAPLAASLEAEGGSDDLFHAPIGWIFRWLQFLVVFGGAGYLIAKKAPAYFRSRQQTIIASITESTRIKDEADRRLKEAEAKLARLDQELAELRAAAQREWAAEAERIRAAAREEARKVERAAQAEMEAAERAARIELRAMAARLAVERAEAMIRQQMTPQTEAALLRSFVENLSGTAAGSAN